MIIWTTKLFEYGVTFFEHFVLDVPEVKNFLIGPAQTPLSLRD